MAEFINQIAIFIQDLVAAIGYPGITLVMFAENLIPPIPSEPLLPFTGILISQGRASFPLVLAFAVLGAMLGTMVLYWIGARFGEPAVRALIRRYGRALTVEEAELDRALILFARYGGPMVFVGRLIPVLRAVTSLTAGISRMPVPQFLLYSVASSALSSSIWILLGYFLGENWETALGIISALEPALWIALVVGAALLIYGYTRRLRNRRAVLVARPEGE
jgi:membrane protein DedA with SNARE-associated domain